MKRGIAMLMSWIMIVSAIFGVLMFTPQKASAVLQTGDITVSQDAVEKSVASADTVVFDFTFTSNAGAGDSAYIWFNITNPSAPSNFNWNGTIGGVISQKFILPSGGQTVQHVAVRARDIARLPANTTDLTHIYYLSVSVHSTSYTGPEVDSLNYYVKAVIQPDRSVYLDFNSDSRSKLASPGGSTSFNMIARNTGESTDRFNLSIQNAPTGWDVEVNPTQTSSLSPNETYAFTLFVNNIPIDARNMTYTIKVQATSINDPTVSTTLQANVWVSASYGYQLSTDTPSVSAAPGDTVHFSVNITNIGNTNSETVVLKLRQPGHTTDAWQNVTPAQTTLTGWGASNLIDVYVTVADDAPSEVRIFYLNATRSDGVYDAPPLALTINVGSYRGALLDIADNSTDTKAVNSGDIAEFSLNLTNVGNKVDTFVIETSQLPGGWTKDIPSKINSLDFTTGSNFRVFQLKVTTKAFTQTQVPKDASGYYPITIKAYPQGDSSNYVTRTVYVYINPEYDLAVQDLDGTQVIVDPGHMGSLRYKLTNYGNVNDTYNVHVELVSAPASFTGTFADTFTLETQAPPSVMDVTYNEYKEFYINITNDRKKIVPGTYTFNLTVTSNGDPTKTTTTQFLYTVTEKYDATLSIIGSDTKVVKPMTTVSFQIKVTNTGSVAETAQLSVGTYNVSEATVEFNQTEIYLTPSAYTEVWVNVTPASGLAANTIIDVPVKVKVKEDTEDLIFDTTTLYVQVDSGYNVNITVPLTSTTTKAGQTLHFTTILRNDGNLNDVLYLTPQMSDFPNDDWQVEYNVSGAVGNVLKTPTMQPKEKFFVDVMILVPPNAQSTEEFNFRLTVTSENDATATDEETLHINVTDTYTVTFKSVVTEKSMDPGIGGTFEVKVWNTGTVADSYDVDITTSVPTYMTVTLSAYQTPVLQPGEIYNITMTVDINISEEFTYDPSVVITVKVTSDARPATVSATMDYTVTINARPLGIEFLSMDDINDVDPGSYTMFNVKVKNTGKLIETFDIEIEGNKPDYMNIEYLDSTGAPITSITIPAKTSMNFTMKVYIDSDTKYVLPSSVDITLKLTSPEFSSLSASHVFTVDINPRRGVSLDSTATEKESLPGNKVVYTITLENTGDDMDTFTISITDNDPYSNWAELSTKTIQNVPAGGTQDFTVTIDIPDDWKPETFTLTVVVTPKDSTTSSQQDSIALKTTVKPVYEAVIKTPDSTKSGNVGETVTFVMTVENRGTVNDSYDITYNEDLYEDWSIQLSPATVTVANGSVSGNITLVIEIPNDARAKDYSFVVRASSKNNDSYAEKTFKLTVKQDYSISVVAIDSETISGKSPGDVVYIDYEITNDGNDNDTVEIKGSGSYSSWIEATPSTVTIAPSETETVRVKVTIPTDTDKLPTNGLATLTVKFSSEGNIPAVERTISITIIGEGKADLTSTYTIKDGFAGDYVNFTVDLENTGTATDDFKLEYTGTWSTYAESVELIYVPSVGSEQRGQQVTIQDLTAGETRSFTLSVKIKDNQDKGTYSIYVKATPLNAQSNYDQLDLSINVKQTYKVDAYVNIPSDSVKSASPGEQVTYQFYVKNLGNGAQNIILSYIPVSTAIDDTWTFSDFSSSSATIVDNKITGLAAGSEAKVSITVTIPDDASAGDYAITFQAKADISNPSASRGEIAELPVTLTVKESYAVELSLAEGKNTESVTLGTTAKSVTRDYEVKNTGNTVDSFTVKVKNLPSGWSATVDPSGPITVASGATKRVTVTITIPAVGSADSGNNNENIAYVASGYKVTVEAASQNSTSAVATQDLTITLGQYHSIALSTTSSTTGLTVPYGDKLTLTVRATNNGNLDETATIKADSVSGDVSVKFTPGSTITVQRGRTVDITVTIEPKATAEAGDTWSLNLVVTYSDSTTSEPLALSGTVEAAQVSISGITITPQNPQAGDLVTITVEVQNTGELDADDLVIKLYVDGEEVDSTPKSIKAGSTETVEFTWTATEGSHEFSVEATSGVMSEKAESKSTVTVSQAGFIPGVSNEWLGLILIIVVIVLIIIFLLVRKPRSEEPEELEKELELAEKRVQEAEKEVEKETKKEVKKKSVKKEASKKPVHVQCPKCNSVMEVTTTKRPVKVRCSECGATLLLKE